MSYVHKFTIKLHSHTTPTSERRYPGPRNAFSTLYWKANPQLWHRVLKHRTSLSTLRAKGLSCSKINFRAIYTNLPVNTIVRLPHLQSRDIQDLETFLAPSADNRTKNYDTEFNNYDTEFNNYETEFSNHHTTLSTLRAQGLSRSKMKWWAMYINLPLNSDYLNFGAEISRVKKRF